MNKLPMNLDSEYIYFIHNGKVIKTLRILNNTGVVFISGDFSKHPFVKNNKSYFDLFKIAFVDFRYIVKLLFKNNTGNSECEVKAYKDIVRNLYITFCAVCSVLSRGDGFKSFEEIVYKYIHIYERSHSYCNVCKISVRYKLDYSKHRISVCEEYEPHMNFF